MGSRAALPTGRQRPLYSQFVAKSRLSFERMVKLVTITQKWYSTQVDRWYNIHLADGTKLELAADLDERLQTIPNHWLVEHNRQVYSLPWTLEQAERSK